MDVGVAVAYFADRGVSQDLASTTWQAEIGQGKLAIKTPGKILFHVRHQTKVILTHPNSMIHRLPRSLFRLVFVATFAGAGFASFAQMSGPPTAEADFKSIFDGKTLTGWDGDVKYWRVQNGCLVGEVTPETVMKQNSFIIWRGGTTGDFELKLEYRISARGNSGINYRSTEVAGQPFALRGYQADLDGQDRNKPPLRHSGQNYEERGRTFLARRGELVRVDATAKPTVVASLGSSESLAAALKSDDWNEVHLIVRGNVLTHIFNGHVMSVVVDDDPANRRADGLLGVQVHVGPPMKVEFRNMRLKQL